MTGQEYIDLSDVKIRGLHEKDGLYIPIEDVIRLLDDFKKQLIIGGVVKSLKDKEALTFEEWKEQNKITISKCGNKLADNEGYVFEEWELIDKYNYEVMSL
tara:strand:+ start:305 stop:607 length:303 start_codon:yes stop_codon:yes gene_type:complete